MSPQAVDPAQDSGAAVIYTPVWNQHKSPASMQQQRMNLVDQQLAGFDLLISSHSMQQPPVPQAGTQQQGMPLGVPPLKPEVFEPLDVDMLTEPGSFSDPLPLLATSAAPSEAGAEPLTLVRPDTVTSSQYSPVQAQLEAFQQLLEDSIAEEQVKLLAQQHQMLEGQRRQQQTQQQLQQRDLLQLSPEQEQELIQMVLLAPSPEPKPTAAAAAPQAAASLPMLAAASGSACGQALAMLNNPLLQPGRPPLSQQQRRQVVMQPAPPHSGPAHTGGLPVPHNLPSGHLQQPMAHAFAHPSTQAEQQQPYMATFVPLTPPGGNGSSSSSSSAPGGPNAWPAMIPTGLEPQQSATAAAGLLQPLAQQHGLLMAPQQQQQQFVGWPAPGMPMSAPCGLQGPTSCPSMEVPLAAPGGCRSQPLQQQQQQWLWQQQGVVLPPPASGVAIMPLVPPAGDPAGPFSFVPAGSPAALLGPPVAAAAAAAVAAAANGPALPSVGTYPPANGSRLPATASTPAAAAATALQAFTVKAIKAEPEFLASGTPTGTPATAAAAAAAGTASQPSGLPSTAEEEEEAMKGMTVMQRYHYKRKLNMQRMEHEVATKLAQLTMLEQENRRLRWQARVLENMLGDIDKQLEVMASAESADAAQWLALLGVGNQQLGSGPRPVHQMLEGSGKVDISGWQLEEYVTRWAAYVAELQPLMAQARDARGTWLAAQQQEAAAASAQRVATLQAAVAAAASAAAASGRSGSVSGCGDADADANSRTGLQQLLSYMQHGAAAQRGSKGARDKAAVARPSCSSSSSGDTGSESTGQGYYPGERFQLQQVGDGRTVWGGPGTEGVPVPLLAQIESLVMENFAWLLAMMTRNSLATYRLVTADLEGQGRTAAQAGDPYWLKVVAGMTGLTQEQMQEAAMSLQLATRCREQVRTERERLQQVLQQQPEMTNSLLPEMARMSGQEAALAAMQRNVRREAIVRNMVGLYCINVLTVYDLAAISVEAYPFFPNAWAVIGAVAEVLQQEQAKQQQEAAAAVAVAGAPRAPPPAAKGRTTRARTRSGH